MLFTCILFYNLKQQTFVKLLIPLLYDFKKKLCTLSRAYLLLLFKLV